MNNISIKTIKKVEKALKNWDIIKNEFVLVNFNTEQIHLIHKSCNNEIVKTLRDFNKYVNRHQYLGCNNKTCKLQRTQSSWNKKDEDEINKIISKTKQTNLKKYGVDNCQKNAIVAKKTSISVKKIWDERTDLEKNDIINKLKIKSVENWNNKSNKEKELIQTKREKTFKDRYGIDSPLQNEDFKEKYKQTCLKNLGVDNPLKNKDIKNKQVQTMIDNKTINSSKVEKELFTYLKKIFPDIKKQYKSILYPWPCDFYIPEYDLYIELQGYWMHGNEAFLNNKYQRNIVKKWTEKNYQRAIKVWTNDDVVKREWARDNKLNYLELFEYNNFDFVVKQIYRTINDLEYKYDNDTLKREKINLENKPGDYNGAVLYNKNVLTFQPHFFEIEKNLFKNDPIVRRFIIQNRIKYLSESKNKKLKESDLTEKELLRGFKISGKHIGFSHFSPLWIKAFIEEYNIKSIYDPCGGWGHRILGLSQNVKYIYNDIDEKTVLGCKNIAKFHNLNNIIFYNNDAADFTPKEDYESVFICPPYFDTEKYNHKNTSTNKYNNYNIWLNVWWNNVLDKSIKKNTKYFALVINNRYKKDLINICLEKKLKIINEYKVGTNNLSHFQKKANIKKQEYLIIFKNI